MTTLVRIDDDFHNHECPNATPLHQWHLQPSAVPGLIQHSMLAFACAKAQTLSLIKLLMHLLYKLD